MVAVIGLTIRSFLLTIDLCCLQLCGGAFCLQLETVHLQLDLFTKNYTKSARAREGRTHPEFLVSGSLETLTSLVGECPGLNISLNPSFPANRYEGL